MDESQIFLKSDKGRDEIATRKDKLGFQQRAALIQTDGKKPASEVLKMVPGGSFSVIAELVAGGYLVLAGASSADAETGGSAAATSNTATAEFDLKAMQRVASHSIVDLLGPNGDMLTGMIEKTKTKAEFDAAVEKASQYIAQAAGSTKSAMFLKKIGYA